MLFTNDNFHFWEPWKWEKDPYWKWPLIMFWCSAIIHFMFYGICSQLDFISGIHGSVICYLWGVCVAVMCRLAWGQMCECTSACISRRWWSSLTPLELSYLQCRLCLFSVCVFQVSCVYGTFWHYASVRASSGSGNVKCLQSVQSAARPAGCHHGEMIALQVAEMQGIAEWML